MRYVPLLSSENREPAFLRHFWIVLAAHAALVGVLWLGSRWWKSPQPEQITWLESGSLAAAAEPAPIGEPPEQSIPEPPSPPPTTPEPPPPPPPAPTPDPGELAAPKPAPTPTPKPPITPTPKPAIAKTPATPRPKAPTPKPRAKVTSKKAQKPAPHIAKTTLPKPRPTSNQATGSKPAPNAQTSNRNVSAAGKGTSNTGNKERAGSPDGTLTQAQFDAYFGTVGARFREVWNQPLIAEATGQDLRASVRIKVNSEGRVLSATVQRSTGNREVDASIEAAITRFRTVPPPPPTLLKEGVMDQLMAVILDR